MTVRPRQAAHQVTTRHAAALYPFQSEGGTGLPGAYIGDDLLGGGSFTFDPFLAYATSPRLVSGPNLAVLGEIGYGKSALAKTFIDRQSVFGRSAFVVDPKGEWAPVARAHGCAAVALRPGGALRLNPLTPRAGWDGQRRLLAAVGQAALGRPLDPTEQAAAREALRDVIDTVAPDTGHGEPLIPDVAVALLRPSEAMARALAMTGRQAQDACRHLALALGRLVSGDLAGMFDGPTSPGLSLDGRVNVLDLSSVYDSAALGVLMLCATSWLRAQLDEHRAVHSDARQYVVIDEAWRVLSDLGCAEWLQDSWKHSRAYGRANLLIAHRLTDLRAAGQAGSRQQRLAEGLLADSETKVVLRQPAGEIEALRSVLGLTDREAVTVTELPTGTALWKIGRRSFLVHHRLSARDRVLVDTDATMGGAA